MSEPDPPPTDDPLPEHDADLDSLANERTLLAWVRTGFALVAAGALALHATDFRLHLREVVVGLGTVAMGVSVWAVGYMRFHSGERAIATEDPLLPIASVRAVAVAVTLASLGSLVLALLAA